MGKYMRSRTLLKGNKYFVWVIPQKWLKSSFEREFNTYADDECIVARFNVRMNEKDSLTPTLEKAVFIDINNNQYDITREITKSDLFALVGCFNTSDFVCLRKYGKDSIYLY